MPRRPGQRAPIATGRNTTIPGVSVASTQSRRFEFRAPHPESWKREQIELWLQQQSEFFALDRGAAVPPESFSDVER